MDSNLDDFIETMRGDCESHHDFDDLRLKLDERRAAAGQKVSTPKSFVKKPLPVRKTTVFKRAQAIIEPQIRIVQMSCNKVEDINDTLAELTCNFGDLRLKLHQKCTDPVVKLPKIRTGIELKTRPLPQRSILASRLFLSQGQKKQALNVPPQSSKILPDFGNLLRRSVDYHNIERMEEEESTDVTSLGPMASEHLDRLNVHEVPHDDHARSMSPELPPPPPKVNWGANVREKLSAPQGMNWVSSSERLDPLDVYEVPHGDHERSMSPELPPPPPKVNWGPYVSEPFERRYIPQFSSHLSHETRSDQERTSDLHAAMGVYTNQMRTPPRQTSSNTRHSIGKTPLERDIDALYKLLFPHP